MTDSTIPDDASGPAPTGLTEFLRLFEVNARRAADAGSDEDRAFHVQRAGEVLEQLLELGLDSTVLESFQGRLAAIDRGSRKHDDVPSDLITSNALNTDRMVDEDRVPGPPPVDAPEASPIASTAASGPSEGVNLTVDAVAAIQYTMHANDVRAIREIRIENEGERTYRDLRLVLTADPAFAPMREIRLDELRPGQVRRLDEPELPLDHGFLDRLTERVAGTLRMEL